MSRETAAKQQGAARAGLVYTGSIIFMQRCVTAIAVYLAVAVLFFGAREAFGALAGNIESRRAELEAELVELEKEIDAQRIILESKQRERVSLERDVAILDAQIEKARLSIRARNITISKLERDIGGKEDTIGSLLEEMERERRSLAQLIRRKHEIDSYSMVEVILAHEDISQVFVDIDSFEFVGRALNESIKQIIETKADTEVEKQSLEEKRIEEIELRQIQELQKRRIEEREKEKATLLRVTKGEEDGYQKVLKAQEKDAAQIRAALFSLRDTAAIPFGKALELAERAYEKTGVRPAFLLGIIAEESNLGENIGTGTWTVDMHPTRDRPVFREITARLGLDPDRMPVSKKPWYGWGGAMGPAQFIPSTWILFEDKVSALTGHNPPNPWDTEDAFMASALLLKDNGAAKGTYSAERLAALRYLAGWKNATKPAYAFYGDDVMALAEKYQGMIDALR